MTDYPKSGGHASGQDGRTLYLDAVDEALKRRGPGAPRGPRRPRRQVNDVAVRQLRDVEKQRRILSRKLADDGAEPCPTCKQPKDLEAGELRALVEASASVSHQIVQLSQSIRLGYKQEAESFKGLTEEQLEAVFRAQIPRIASGMTDAERRTVLEIWFGPDVADVLLRQRKVA